MQIGDTVDRKVFLVGPLARGRPLRASRLDPLHPMVLTGIEPPRTIAPCGRCITSQGAFRLPDTP